MNWEELKIFKAWAKRELRYEAVGLPGEGASRQRTEEDGGATRTGANGIMFMVDSERGRFNHIEREGGGNAAPQEKRLVERVEERVGGVEVSIKGYEEPLAIIGMHGLHDTGDEERSFTRQLKEARRWVDRRGGGVVAADFNKVVCRGWRNQPGWVMNSEEDRNDRLLRRIARWGCTCCARANEAREAGPSRVIGGQGDVGEQDGVGWTRFGHHDPTARLDYALEFGREEGRWKLTDQSRPRWEDEELGDHAKFTIKKTLPARRRPELARRLMHVKMTGGPQQREAGRWFNERTGSEEFMIALRGDTSKEQEEGRSGAEWWVRVVREEAEFAQRRLIEEKQKLQQAVMRACGVQPEPAHHEYQQWKRRLELARSLHRQGVTVDECVDRILFHPKTGLGRIRTGMRGAESDRVWWAIIRKCRDKALKGGARAARSMEGDKARWLQASRKLVVSTEEPLVKYLKAWKALSKPRTPQVLEKLREDDSERGSTVDLHAQPERAYQLGGEIGHRFVQQMEGGANVAGFQAWCDVFMQSTKAYGL